MRRTPCGDVWGAHGVRCYLSDAHARSDVRARAMRGDIRPQRNICYPCPVDMSILRAFRDVTPESNVHNARGPRVKMRRVESCCLYAVIPWGGATIRG